MKNPIPILIRATALLLILGGVAGATEFYDEAGKRKDASPATPLPVALYPPSSDSTLTSTITCQTVDDDPAVAVLAANTDRVAYAIWTTSGASTIYWRTGGTAVAKAAGSGVLTAGLSRTYDVPGTVATGAVSAIAVASGAAWVCVEEISR